MLALTKQRLWARHCLSIGLLRPAFPEFIGSSIAFLGLLSAVLVASDLVSKMGPSNNADYLEGT